MKARARLSAFNYADSLGTPSQTAACGLPWDDNAEDDSYFSPSWMRLHFACQLLKRSSNSNKTKGEAAQQQIVH